MIRVFSVFTGVGGFEIGIEAALGKENVKHVGFCQYEPCVKGKKSGKQHASAVLKFHWPDVLNFGDITKLDYSNLPDFDLLVQLKGRKKEMTGSLRSGMTVKRIRSHKIKKNDLIFMSNGQMCIREATEKGYAEIKEGQAVDVSFPNSQTRRGRVGDKAKNIMTQESIMVALKDFIRPLYPIECERLMTWPDNWTAKGIDEKGNVYDIPKTARVKLCGNEVVSRVVEHICKGLKNTEGIV